GSHPHLPSFPTRRSSDLGPHQHSAQDIISGQLPPERIGNLPASKITSGQFSPDRIPNLPASKITSGTFDRARLPAASTSQPGIVQLTSSRSSTSETLAVTAAALNAHRTSADHDDRYYTKSQADDRYYTKSQVDNLVASSGLQWIVPGNTVLAESLTSAATGVQGDTWYTLKRFVVSRPGRYRITGQFRVDGSF